MDANHFLDAAKAALSLKTDEDLAKATGVSRQAVANWRSRGKVPAAAQTQLRENYGFDYSDWAGKDVEAQNIARAVALHAIFKSASGSKETERPTMEMAALFARLFPMAVAISSTAILKSGLTVSDPENAMDFWLSYYDSGNMPELTDLCRNALK
ncbi:MAG: helix-turn-helix domain-containing protein [Pseudomonadota bacterium]